MTKMQKEEYSPIWKVEEDEDYAEVVVTNEEDFENLKREEKLYKDSIKSLKELQ
jgi:hypothetical protein